MATTAIEKRFCTNHPDRPAIGVCVITRKAICVECSTRYEGVNYSKEALALLQGQRAAAAKTGVAKALAILAWCLTPLMVYLLYFAYVTAANAVMNLLRGSILKPMANGAYKIDSAISSLELHDSADPVDSADSKDPSDPVESIAFLETQGSCLAPLDSAAEYIRRRLGVVVPLYVLAMLPFSAVTLLLIDAINTRQRTAVTQYCLYLVPATIWRWVWLARLQQRVQQDMQSRRGGPLVRRLGSILLLRIFGSNAMTWGSLLACVPSFYGLFIGSFAAPLLLESSEPAATYGRLKSMLPWINHSAWRLAKVVLAVCVGTGLLVVALLVNQYLLEQTILPTLLGLDVDEFDLTLNGWAWRLSFFYFIFLAVDCFWTVAAVVLYYDSQSRRMAADLRIRLDRIAEGQA